MDKFAVVTCTDGAFLIRTEWGDKASAFKAFHSLCAALWNDTGFSTAMVKVLDENLDCVEGKMEFIQHEIVQQTPPAETPAEPAENPEEA